MRVIDLQEEAVDYLHDMIEHSLDRSSRVCVIDGSAGSAESGQGYAVLYEYQYNKHHAQQRHSSSSSRHRAGSTSDTGASPKQQQRHAHQHHEQPQSFLPIHTADDLRALLQEGNKTFWREWSKQRPVFTLTVPESQRAGLAPCAQQLLRVPIRYAPDDKIAAKCASIAQSAARVNTGTETGHQRGRDAAVVGAEADSRPLFVWTRQDRAWKHPYHGIENLYIAHSTMAYAAETYPSILASCAASGAACLGPSDGSQAARLSSSAASNEAAWSSRSTRFRILNPWLNGTVYSTSDFGGAAGFVGRLSGGVGGGNDGGARLDTDAMDAPQPMLYPLDPNVDDSIRSYIGSLPETERPLLAAAPLSFCAPSAVFGTVSPHEIYWKLHQSPYVFTSLAGRLQSFASSMMQASRWWTSASSATATTVMPGAEAADPAAVSASAAESTSSASGGAQDRAKRKRQRMSSVVTDRRSADGHVSSGSRGHSPEGRGAAAADSKPQNFAASAIASAGRQAPLQVIVVLRGWGASTSSQKQHRKPGLDDDGLPDVASLVRRTVGSEALDAGGSDSVGKDSSRLAKAASLEPAIAAAVGSLCASTRRFANERDILSQLPAAIGACAVRSITTKAAADALASAAKDGGQDGLLLRCPDDSSQQRGSRGVALTFVRLELLPFALQVQLARASDIFVGMHGAAMVHGMWLRGQLQGGPDASGSTGSHDTAQPESRSSPHLASRASSASGTKQESGAGASTLMELFPRGADNIQLYSNIARLGGAQYKRVYYTRNHKMEQRMLACARFRGMACAMAARNISLTGPTAAGDAAAVSSNGSAAAKAGKRGDAGAANAFNSGTIGSVSGQRKVPTDSEAFWMGVFGMSEALDAASTGADPTQQSAADLLIQLQKREQHMALGAALRRAFATAARKVIHDVIAIELLSDDDATTRIVPERLHPLARLLASVSDPAFRHKADTGLELQLYEDAERASNAEEKWKGSPGSTSSSKDGSSEGSGEDDADAPKGSSRSRATGTDGRDDRHAVASSSGSTDNGWGVYASLSALLSLITPGEDWRVMVKDADGVVDAGALAEAILQVVRETKQQGPL